MRTTEKKNTLQCRLNSLKPKVWVLVVMATQNTRFCPATFTFFQPINSVSYLLSVLCDSFCVHHCVFLCFIYNSDALYLPEIKWQLLMAWQPIWHKKNLGENQVITSTAPPYGCWISSTVKVETPPRVSLATIFFKLHKNISAFSSYYLDLLAKVCLKLMFK